MQLQWTRAFIWHVAWCIDLNMVRAGVVKQPAGWAWSGYVEIQSPPKRYRVIDQRSLMELLDIGHYEQLQQDRKDWVESLLVSPQHARDPAWSNSIAVGSCEYVEYIKDVLGIAGKYKQTAEEHGSCVLREPLAPYTWLFIAEKMLLSLVSSFFHRLLFM
ncbi:MAG: hypothetical protein HKP12_06105 [Gammaproteobacteria bacterium]|nr:hypothetical protein [Gammaproteobacteria bacterium]